MNKISITTKYNKNMIPCIIFGEYGWNFIFVDTKNNKCIKDEDITKIWLNRNHITEYEFTNSCWNEYDDMRDGGVECGLISYFTKDDAKVFNYAQGIDVEEIYKEIFNF